MAKGEGGRGWRKYIPSGATIVKVFLAMGVVRLLNTYIVNPNQKYLPTIVQNAWPRA
jgi:hypothetical protein